MPYPSFPIIGVKGSARSGKDTVAGFLAEVLGGVLVAQADPMKRFAGDVFGFSEEQLWGGAAKEAVDPRSTDSSYWAQAEQRLLRVASDYLEQWGLEGRDLSAFTLLQRWFRGLEETPGRFSPRVALQTLGTEFGRAVDKDMWSSLALLTASKLLDGGHSYSREKGLLFTNNPPPGWVLITDVRFRNEVLNIKAHGGWILEVINPASTGPSTVGIAGHASETELASIPATWTDVRFTNDKELGLDAAREQVKMLVRQLFKVEAP